MNIFNAMQIVDGELEAAEEEQVAAWQALIDQGLVWTLPGRYGRMARDMIDSGVCHSRAVEYLNTSTNPGAIIDDNA